jgi:hypothetical protein
MIRTPRPALVAAVLSALLGTGCTMAVDGTAVADPAPAPTEGPGSDPVAWVDRVCGAQLSYTTPALQEPEFEDADLASIKKRLSDYLAALATGVQESRTQLGEVGSSPVEGGDEVVARAEGTLLQLEQQVTDAKTEFDAADVTDPEKFLAAIDEAERKLSRIVEPNLLAEIGALPRLDKAAAKALNCQQLTTAGTPG